MQSTLVLNASYEPLSVVSVQRAVSLIISGRATSVDDSSAVMRSATSEIRIPFVIKLNDMVKKKGKRSATSFSRRGVLVRDKFTCVYCGEKASTIDHVVPRMLGGRTTYENCVAACGRCNHKKGHKTLETLGWSLKSMPRNPSWYAVMLARCPKESAAHQSWSKHISLWDTTVSV